MPNPVSLNPQLQMDTATEKGDQREGFGNNQFKAFLSKIKPYGIFFLLLLIGIYRFSLTDRGALSNPDEVRYWDAADAWEKLVGERDLRGFFISFSSATHGRVEGTNKPGDTMLRLVPSLFQGILWKVTGGKHLRDPNSDMINTGIHFRNPESLRIVTSFNVFVSLGLLWVFYAISLNLFKGYYGAAWIATTVYGLLANSNIYIRHILPYDSALLVFLLAIYCILRKSKEADSLLLKTCIVAGLLAGFGFTIYPGYYALVAVTAIMIWEGKEPFFSRSRILRYLIFSTSFFGVLGFFEVLARLGKTSYLFYLGHHAERIIQGSFEEGFSFLPKYLLQVEKGIGGLLLGGSILYLFKEFRGLLKKEITQDSTVPYQPQLRILFFTGAACFFFHATLSISEKMVFYGRLLHMYFPFLVWGTIAFVVDLRSKPLRRFLMYGIVPILSFVSFFDFSKVYAQIAYPLDVLYQLGINTEHLPSTNIISESKPYMHFLSPPPRNFKTGEPYSRNSSYLLINFFSFLPSEKDGYKLFLSPANARLIYQRPHFQNLPAYMFEAYSIQERKWIQERNYQVSVYELT